MQALPQLNVECTREPRRLIKKTTEKGHLVKTLHHISLLF